MPTLTGPTTRWAHLRDHLQQVRRARASHAALQRQLSAYTTDADLLEWDAILARYDDDQTSEIRDILNRHRAA